MSTTKKKVKQSDVVLNYLNEKPGRKISTDTAMKITKAKTKASMNYLLPSMAKDGLITRVDTGIYSLPVNAKVTKKSPAPVAVKKAKPFKSNSNSTVLDTVSVRSKLLAKKQEHLKSVEAIDKQIDNIDKLEKHATSVIKGASTVL